MKRLAYLSGSPRVSTRPQAEEHGPTCHLLGTMSGFRASGWSVFPYIVGDMVPLAWVTGPGFRSQAGTLKLFASDIFRIASNRLHAGRAFHGLGHRVDLVYERYGAFQSLGRSFQRSGIPWILETNTPFSLENRWESSRRTIFFLRAAENHERQAYRGCDALVVQTAVLKEIVVRFAKISPDKVFVVPNAVKMENHVAIEPIRKFAGPTIGFAGALRRWQALGNLIRALGEVSREGIFFHLLIVGDGEKRREWEKLASDLDLSGRVIFTGSVPSDRIPAWVAGFDLGFSGPAGTVAAQQMYFSPLKMYEYMAAAKPVLASAHEDSLRLVAPGETGFLFAADSFTDLKRALRRAWQERAAWPAMGAQARRRIAAGHTWDIRIGGMLVQLQDFLSSRGFPAFAKHSASPGPNIS